jgi:hypothetical protein
MDQLVTHARPRLASAAASARRGFAAASLAALLALPPQPAAALGPAAPFTPPRALLEADEAAGSGSARGGAPAPHDGAAARPAAAEATPAAANGPAVAGLAGLRLGHRPQALIDGQWWAPGSRPRGALLVAIEKQGVWLRDSKGHREFLALLPDAAATPSPLAAAALPRRTTAPDSPPLTPKRTSP